MKPIYLIKILTTTILIGLAKISDATPLYLECIMNGSILSSGKKLDGQLPEEMVSLRIEDTKSELKFNAKSQNYLISLNFKKDRLLIENESIYSRVQNDSSQDLYKISKHMKVSNLNEYSRLELNRVTGQLVYSDHSDYGNEQFLLFLYSGICNVAKRQIRRF
jgi:hypothetical protein